MPAGSHLAVTGQYHREPSGRRQLALRSGRLDIAVIEGRLTLSGLELALDDVKVAPADVAIHLTGLRVTQEAPAVLTVRQAAPGGLGASASGELTLLLDWALVVDGGTYPLAQQRIEGLPVRLALDAGVSSGVSGLLEVSFPGVFWDWAGLIELSGLELSVPAILRPAARVE